jgi:hypothetical protein
MAKLALIISVILVGSFVISGALDDMLKGPGDAETELIAAAYDVVALTVAAGLGDFKPGRRISSWRERATRRETALGSLPAQPQPPKEVSAINAASLPWNEFRRFQRERRLGPSGW